MWLADHVSAVERLFEANDDGLFACPIPGHVGLATIGIPPEDQMGEPRILCCSGRWRSLGDSLAARSYGVPGGFRSNIELAIWNRRLAFEIGALQPVLVTVSVPGDEPRDVVRVAAGFALLVGIRWADHERRAVAWSVRFASAWCGVSHRQANLAIQRLLELDAIVEEGRVGRVRLYLPGTGASPPSGSDNLVARAIEVLDATEIGAA